MKPYCMKPYYSIVLGVRSDRIHTNISHGCMTGHIKFTTRRDVMYAVAGLCHVLGISQTPISDSADKLGPRCKIINYLGEQHWLTLHYVDGKVTPWEYDPQTGAPRLAKVDPRTTPYI